MRPVRQALLNQRAQPLVARVVKRRRTLATQSPDAEQDGLKRAACFFLAPDLDSRTY